MRKLLLVAAIFGGLFGYSGISTAQLPQPGPEQKKLEIMVGEWTYEGEQFDSPFGPKGKVVGSSSCKLILGGFFVQENWSESNPAGPMSGVDIYSYDAKKKSYVHNGFVNDGSTAVSTLTFDGTTRSTTSKATTIKGEVADLKGTTVYSADRTSFSYSFQFSRDNGKTWMPLLNLKGKKKAN